MITELRLDDVCLPCYWQGSREVVLAVPLWKGMTWGEFREAVDEESNAADWGIDNWRGFGAALDALVAGYVPNHECWFVMDLEDDQTYDGDYEDLVYAYVEIIQED